MGAVSSAMADCYLHCKRSETLEADVREKYEDTKLEIARLESEQVGIRKEYAMSRHLDGHFQETIKKELAVRHDANKRQLKLKRETFALIEEQMRQQEAAKGLHETARTAKTVRELGKRNGATSEEVRTAGGHLLAVRDDAEDLRSELKDVSAALGSSLDRGADDLVRDLDAELDEETERRRATAVSGMDTANSAMVPIADTLHGRGLRQPRAGDDDALLPRYIATDVQHDRTTVGAIAGRLHQGYSRDTLKSIGLQPV
jgi:hypothetical protein